LELGDEAGDVVCRAGVFFAVWSAFPGGAVKGGECDDADRRGASGARGVIGSVAVAFGGGLAGGDLEEAGVGARTVELYGVAGDEDFAAGGGVSGVAGLDEKADGAAFFAADLIDDFAQL